VSTDCSCCRLAPTLYNRRMYSPQLLHYFQDARFAGEVAAPNASAQVENPVCGDVLRLSARVTDGKIEEIRFKVKGCVPAMACASAVADLVHGRSLKHAANVSREQLLEKLGGLPEASVHAGHLAMDALGALLKAIEGQ
jgi:nitrogen fixation protein NifU and related proteins